MSEEVPIVNPPLSAEERSVVAQLTDIDFQNIDAAILSGCCNRWIKAARVALWTEKALSKSYSSLSYVFYAQRLVHLVEQGRLESRGNLEYMRFSEIRLPCGSNHS